MARVTFGSSCWKEIDVIPTAALGSAAAGGYLICKSGGTAWIVAPNTTEVSRNWNCRDDAVTTAQANAACGDWFVPTCTQLQNPGYTCRTNWDSYSFAKYWSSTELNGPSAVVVCFPSGHASTYGFHKGDTHCVRAFRCVTY